MNNLLSLKHFKSAEKKRILLLMRYVDHVLLIFTLFITVYFKFKINNYPCVSTRQISDTINRSYIHIYPSKCICSNNVCLAMRTLRFSLGKILVEKIFTFFEHHVLKIFKGNTIYTHTLAYWHILIYFQQDDTIQKMYNFFIT